MFGAIDRWIAKLFIPRLIRTDAGAKEARNFKKQKQLVNYLYNKRVKHYRKYGITKEYIEKVL